ncbi:hypothetical protein FGO68_gene10740 [Halteria grandinella]|uniref:Uncharacterized protein n=1 Tax=Halteria grandinella TaxID=5974 RepID=A0A8J8T925_HALGN|nr:hypothetical protein FGO68_gene10740 [Halteria grandinella]
MEYLEGQIQEGIFTGRMVHRDMERFHEEFKESRGGIDSCIGRADVKGIYSVIDRVARFVETLEKEFESLAKIGQPDFLFENYKSCLQSVQIPVNHLLTDSIIALKVMNGEVIAPSVPRGGHGPLGTGRGGK